MIELSMEKWGSRLLRTGRYKTISYNYIGKYTLLRDMKMGVNYKAVYNLKTLKMNLTRVRKNG